MKNLAICAALAVFGASALAAHAQETPAAAAAEATTQAAPTNECSPPRAPGRLQITMPSAPVKPACAAKMNCSKAVADKFNAEITSYNAFMMKVNSASADYVNELNAYSLAANRYANCEITRINDVATKNN